MTQAEYNVIENRYYGRNYPESQFEFESRMWDITHPNALIRYEPLDGERCLQRMKMQIERSGDTYEQARSLSDSV